MMLSEVKNVVHGRQIGMDVSFSSVSIDTRTLQRGDFFVAIEGERFDANKFVEQAETFGAVAAMVGREVETNLPTVIVDDTRLALGQLAGEWRNRANIPLIGVTGSNGKTTVKEIIAAILGVKHSVLATRGNLNNDIGVPLTLFGIEVGHQFAVVEMGANHAGEIAYTSSLARPDVAVITNAGSAHLEGFGSIEGVARAKGELLAALKPNGTAVLNADDDYLSMWRQIARDKKVITFGLSEQAMVRGNLGSMSVQDACLKSSFEISYRGADYSMSIPLAGLHNIGNALAATAACRALGISMQEIRAGLEAMEPVPGRLQVMKGHKGELIINDTYNANPSSTDAALDVLTDLPGQPWVVLGAFAEMGEESPEWHAKVGRQAKQKGAKRLFATGDNADRTVQSFGAGGEYFRTQAELIEALAKAVNENAVVLVKGSRGQRMEKVVEALCQSRKH